MYRLGIDCVVRLTDGACIPIDPSNVDYQDYLAWVASGGQPLPVAAPQFDFIAAGAARAERVIERLAKTDPLTAALLKGGIAT